MTREQPVIVMGPNSPYTNRGCEAIVRGTVNILKNHYVDPIFLYLGRFPDKSAFTSQQKRELDSKIHYIPPAVYGQYHPMRYIRFGSKIISPKIYRRIQYKTLREYLTDVLFVLALGGDNYSLNYGIPTEFVSFDTTVLSQDTTADQTGFTGIGKKSQFP